MTLGQKIRSARIALGLTQKQLVGDHITRNMLSKIEHDSATPSVKTLEYLAGRLGLSAGYLLADSQHSDGTSPDGLDDMRAAYKAGRYTQCIQLLEASPAVGTTDEGYYLRTRAALAAAQAALMAGDVKAAKDFADSADYYNKQGMYYSAAIDTEMSLILAECALELDISEFEEHAVSYEDSVRAISFADRYTLARAEYLLKTDELELAARLIASVSPGTPPLRPRLLYLKGLHDLYSKNYEGAAELLTAAELAVGEDRLLLRHIYKSLEQCYISLENYRMAHKYASKQLS